MNDNKNEKDKIVKKRGRPKKEVSVVDNETDSRITMTSKQVLDQGVGTIQDTPTTPITLNDIQSRWSTIFQKYQNQGFESIMNSWRDVSAGLNNPYIQNERIKRISGGLGQKVDKQTLQSALQDPLHNELVLRNVSTHLYYTNYIYQTIVKFNRDVPKFNYYATPLYVTDSDKKAIQSDSVKIDKILKAFNPKLTFKTIASQVAVEGKSSYLIRKSYDAKDVNFFLLQKLNSNNVKLTGFGAKQQFVASFNMSIFLEPGYSLSQYPQYIKDAWDTMMDMGIVTEDKRGHKHINPQSQLPTGHMIENGLNGTYMYWVALPQDLCYTFYSDGMHPGVFPEEIGLLDDFSSLDDYQWLQGSLLSKGINSILTAEVPFAYQPKAGADQTAVSVDSILGFTSLFQDNIAENVLPFFAPFTNYKLHTLTTEPEALNVVYSRIRDLLASSGLSGLVTLSDKPSISSVQTARMLQESKVDYLTRQFEQFLNNVINENFDLKLKWNIRLHSGIFNWREDVKQVKELVSQGQIGLLPRLLSYFDETIEDYKGSTLYLDALDISIGNKEETEDQTDEENKPVGRPKLNDDEITSDNTGISSDMGNNQSEIKQYIAEQVEELLGEVL